MRTSGARRLPEFDGAALEAKYALISGRAFNGPERDAFAVIERMALRFSLADRVLISTPMWNFSIPYKLKQWIDLSVQPGLTFRFNPPRAIAVWSRTARLSSSSPAAATS